MALRRSLKLFFAGAMMATATGGCSATPRTEVIVSVTTDYDIPAEMDAFAITVAGPGMEIRTSRAALTGPADLPRTLGLVHEGGPLGPFDVTIDGTHPVRGDVATRRARFEFQRGRTMVLEIRLSRVCEGVRCAGDETCEAGACRSIDVLPPELQPWPPEDGGERADSAPDTSPADSAMDGIVGDTAPADTGPADTGPADTGPTTDTGPADTGVDGAGTSCDDLFGMVTSYQLCDARPIECEFYVRPARALSCDEVCALSGENCVESYDPEDSGGRRCVRNRIRTCVAPAGEFICICTRSP